MAAKAMAVWYGLLLLLNIQLSAGATASGDVTGTTVITLCRSMFNDHSLESQSDSLHTDLQSWIPGPAMPGSHITGSVTYEAKWHTAAVRHAVVGAASGHDVPPTCQLTVQNINDNSMLQSAADFPSRASVLVYHLILVQTA
eukprot:GHUV01029714.1.p1 GENE.GHUV01029714.1~~GHUV01029714.1.p1  ORF type:complete len:142 (-),score=18.10 GHUV01029714.1:541-966(-)